MSPMWNKRGWTPEREPRLPHATVILLLLFAAAIAASSWSTFWHRTPTTVTVTVIFTVATALAALYDTPKLSQRLLKLAITMLLVILQWQAISRERRTQELQSQKASEETNAHFASVLADQQRLLLSTEDAEHLRQQQFQTTIDRLDTSLRTQRDTFDQTRPRAAFSDALETQNTSSYGTFVDATLTNVGTDVARDFDAWIDVLAKPEEWGDIIHQGPPTREILQTFDAHWAFVLAHQHDPGFYDYTWIPPGDHKNYHSVASIEKILAAGPSVFGASATLYVLVRIRYTDQRGVQFFNDCQMNTYTFKDKSMWHFRPCTVPAFLPLGSGSFSDSNFTYTHGHLVPFKIEPVMPEQTY